MHITGVFLGGVLSAGIECSDSGTGKCQGNGKTVILLGIEKILELKWNNMDDMTGLILHELGHAYQEKYGVLYRQYQVLSDQFLWQLFTEGIAMVFEQEILNDSDYYHQNKDGWKDWCDQNIRSIAVDFESDYQKMTRENQRYFGDWVRYEIEDVKPVFYEFIRSI